jgi:NAD(P)-dependent dehydrogenase (short-subunit alcohol dehydrogenase family)
MELALVTGASKGIGREIALALSGAGHTVIAVSRTPMAHSENIVNICGDVSDVDFVNSLQRQVSSEHGNVQILVNAAGIFGPIGAIKAMG